MFLFWVRAACELRSTSYGSKHTSQSLQYTILCVLTSTTRKLQVLYGHSPYWTTLYYWRCLFPGLELYARYNWWVMASSMHFNLFPLRHFVHAYTHNSKTTGCIWTFCISNDCSTIDVGVKRDRSLYSLRPGVPCHIILIKSRCPVQLSFLSATC